MLFNEEPDMDKGIIAISNVFNVIEKIINESKTSNYFEIPATSPLFLARLGQYKGTISILKAIGFQLSNKPQIGLIYTLKNTPSVFKTAQTYKRMLIEFIELLKECRIKEQFSPDYIFAV